jgi:DNA-binding CsgD family transcriptional regulator
MALCSLAMRIVVLTGEFLPRLLEREDYLSEFRALFEGARDHPFGPIIVEGGAGFGKTTLVGAARQIAKQSGWAVLYARPNDTVASLLGLAVRLLDSHAFEPPAVAPNEEPAEMIERLDRLVTQLALDTGVVVAVDDAHFLGDEATEWLQELGRRPAHRRTQVIVSLAERIPQSPLRPIERILSEPDARVMSLKALSIKATGELIAEHLSAIVGQLPEESFIRACHETCKGVPFLAAALLQKLMIVHASPTLNGVKYVETATSPAVARSVLFRLSGASLDSRLAFDAIVVANTVAHTRLATSNDEAAVIPVDIEMVGEMTKLSATRLRAALKPLMEGGLVALDGLDLTLVPLVCRTSYEEIEPRRRSKLHLRAAGCLRERHADPIHLAQHLLAVEPGRRDWVAEDMARAGRAALQRGSSEQAVTYLRRSLAESTPLDDPELWLDLARAEIAIDQRAAVEHLVHAVEARVDSAIVAEVAVVLSRSVDDLDAKSRLAPILNDVAAALPSSNGYKMELYIASVLLHASPGALVVVDQLRPLFAMTHPRSQAERKASALLAIADTVSPRKRSSAVIADSLRQAIDEEHLWSGDRVDCELWAMALLAFARAGELEEAHLMARRAYSESRSFKLKHAELDFLLTLAISLAMQGRLREAEVHARDTLLLSEGRAWDRRPQAIACLVSVLLDQGRYGEADDLVAQFAGTELIAAPFEGLTLLEQRGRLRGCQGRMSEAISDVLTAGRRAEQLGVDSPVVTTWRSEAALLLSKEGRTTEAEHLARENLALARAHGADWVVGSALRVLALVGSSNERVERLEKAVQLLEQSAAQLQLAMSVNDLGWALRASGSSTVKVRTVLRRAADLAVRLGASPLAARSAAELRRSGARPRRLALWGPGALTPGERRVVELAANGLTNAEIAGELYLSEKTVEGHLARAYRKLGIQSRRELKKLVRDPADDIQLPAV